MTYNVFSGTLNPTHSLTHFAYQSVSTVGGSPDIVVGWGGVSYFFLKPHACLPWLRPMHFIAHADEVSLR